MRELIPYEHCFAESQDTIGNVTRFPFFISHITGEDTIESDRLSAVGQTMAEAGMRDFVP